MMNRTTYATVFAAIGSLASTVAAQEWTVHEASRTVYCQAYGFDWEFDNGEESEATTESSNGEWIRIRDVSLVDWYGIDVGESDGYHESHVEPGRIDALLDCSASTAGNHFHEDASGRGTVDVEFDVPYYGLRYLFVGEADSTYGYNMANVRLRHVPSATTIVSLNADYGDDESLVRTGWLPPGRYSLEATSEALAWGDNGHAELQMSHVEFELVAFAPGDFDMDGDVDADDATSYRQAWYAGSSLADVDGDGSVNWGDAAAFAKMSEKSP